MMNMDFKQSGFELHLTSISMGILAPCCHRENEKTASMLHFPCCSVWSPGFDQKLMTITELPLKLISGLELMV